MCQEMEDKVLIFIHVFHQNMYDITQFCNNHLVFHVKLIFKTVCQGQKRMLGSEVLIFTFVSEQLILYGFMLIIPICKCNLEKKSFTFSNMGKENYESE